MENYEGLPMNSRETIVNEDTSEPKEGLSAEVKDAIEKVRQAGLYEEELFALKPGEIPSPELTSKMIISILISPGEIYDLGLAEVLMKDLPFDDKRVKTSVGENVIKHMNLSERDIREMEIVGIEPNSLHDKAVEMLPDMLHLIISGRIETYLPKNIRKWKETFGISDEEYNEALREYWEKNNGRIPEKYLFILGFLKNEGGVSHWAWEEER